uniref:Fe-S-containing hydro-lyase n=1 Tax=candidate division WOR-3 bacterium TaxID=2052148 RepID=A0A7C4UB91_UNCW3
MIKIKSPLDEGTIKVLKAGDFVLLSGIIYTGRDAAHKRFIEIINKGEKLSFDIKNSVIYYVGPTPPKPGYVIGSCGPTTSYRMDKYTPKLLEIGLKGMIGKGERNKDVIDAIVKYRGVYFTAIGGAGAFISKCVKKADVIAFEDLGPEAVMRLEVEDFPLIVTIDANGNDFSKIGIEKYRRV